MNERKIGRRTSIQGNRPGGAAFEVILTLRVAAPSRFSKGRKVWFFLGLSPTRLKGATRPNPSLS